MENMFHIKIELIPAIFFGHVLRQNLLERTRSCSERLNWVVPFDLNPLLLETPPSPYYIIDQPPELSARPGPHRVAVMPCSNHYPEELVALVVHYCDKSKKIFRPKHLATSFGCTKRTIYSKLGNLKKMPAAKMPTKPEKLSGDEVFSGLLKYSQIAGFKVSSSSAVQCLADVRGPASPTSPREALKDQQWRLLIMVCTRLTYL